MSRENPLLTAAMVPPLRGVTIGPDARWVEVVGGYLDAIELSCHDEPPGGMPFIQIAGIAGRLFGLVLILNPVSRLSFRSTYKDDHSKYKSCSIFPLPSMRQWRIIDHGHNRDPDFYTPHSRHSQR